MALVGPGGPLAHEQPALVAATTSADTLPATAVGLCEDDGETHPNVSGPVQGAGTYATPREALAFYLAAEPYLSQGDYQEIELPDGSFGYAYRPQPDMDPATVLHVAPSGDGWSVVSFDRTAC